MDDACRLFEDRAGRGEVGALVASGLGKSSIAGPRRCLMIFGTVALAGLSAFATWWMTTLSGLPDIGDPFDVEAFVEAPVRDDENAYVLYRQAADRFVEEPSEITLDWATTGPVGRGWLERNRESLELWRRGSERPGSLYVPARSLDLMTPLPVVNTVRQIIRLARLEGGRLESEGDLGGAWRWYRAMFRSSRHLGRHATAIERFVGIQVHQQACRQLTLWASDPRVTPSELRRALDLAIEDYRATSPASDTLKVEYLGFLKTYDDPELVRKCLNDFATAGRANSPWFARDAGLFGVSKVLKKEPERSRRVTRLIYANLLAVCDLPAARRPPVACQLPNPGGGPGLLADLYQLDDSSTPQARAIQPERVIGWFRSTLYASRLTPALSPILQAIDREKTTQATLVIALANRLFEKERGKPPESYRDLVGPYLEALPEGLILDP